MRGWSGLSSQSEGLGFPALPNVPSFLPSRRLSQRRDRFHGRCRSPQVQQSPRAQFFLRSDPGFDPASPASPALASARGPAPESTINMNTTKIGNLRLNNAEEDALVSFMRTLTDGYMRRDQK